MEVLVRQKYIDVIEHYLGKECIIVLVGQRRVGKSCTLKMLRDKKMQEEGANVIYVDKEKREFDFIQTYRDLNEYIEEHYAKGLKNYILLDEVQDIAEFERTLRSYRTEPDAEVIVTGSNAKMLSGELSTLIGGRYKEIHIQPLDYSEFLVFHQLTDSDESLARYLQYGGMPGLVKFGLNEEDSPVYLKDIYHTVLLKDVIMRNAVRNVSFLERLLLFLADNVGKLVSSNSIARYMKSHGESVTAMTVLDYARYLEEAYVIRRVPRYDIHGKRLLESNDKYYFEDHGLRNALVGGTREGDVEKVVENIVYEHLVRMGYEVAVGQLQAGEVDFVCSGSDGRRAYVQVAYLIVDEATRAREFGNLQQIKDHYPKYVISMTPLLTRNDDNGITHLPLRQFLQQSSLS